MFVFSAGPAPPSASSQEQQQQRSSLSPSSSSSSSAIKEMYPQQTALQETCEPVNHVPTNPVPTPSGRPESHPVGRPASPRRLPGRQPLPVATVDYASKLALPRLRCPGTTTHTMVTNITRRDTSTHSVPRNSALLLWQRSAHGQAPPGHQPRPSSQRDALPIATHILPISTAAQQQDPVVKPREALKPIPSRRERSTVAAHTTSAAESSKSPTSSASPYLDSSLQKYCKAGDSGGGKPSADQIYEIAVAELHNTRRELTLILQERSTANAMATKAETSVRTIRSILKKRTVNPNMRYRCQIKEYLVVQSAYKAMLARINHTVQLLRLEARRQMCAVGFCGHFRFLSLAEE